MRAQIVMATHNPRPDLLTRQVTSLQAQTVTDWECLVLDDASEDRGAALALFADDPRFRVLPAREHLGAYRAFEHLLQQANPDVPVFLCDQDDVWHPTKLERLLSLQSSAFSAMRVVDENGAVVRDRFLPRPPSRRALTPAGLLLMNSASGTALVITPTVRAAALPFPAPHLRGWHDQWLAAVAAHIEGLEYLDEPLVDYTQHGEQVVGDGLRRITRDRIRAYGRRLHATGVRRELHQRTGWVQAAAARLLELGSANDPDLVALANGHMTRQLIDGVRARNVPLSRAALLELGRL